MRSSCNVVVPVYTGLQTRVEAQTGVTKQAGAVWDLNQLRSPWSKELLFQTEI